MRVGGSAGADRPGPSAASAADGWAPTPRFGFNAGLPSADRYAQIHSLTSGTFGRTGHMSNSAVAPTVDGSELPLQGVNREQDDGAPAACRRNEGGGRADKHNRSGVNPHLTQPHLLLGVCARKLKPFLRVGSNSRRELAQCLPHCCPRPGRAQSRPGLLAALPFPSRRAAAAARMYKSAVFEASGSAAGRRRSGPAGPAWRRSSGTCSPRSASRPTSSWWPRRRRPRRS